MTGKVWIVPGSAGAAPILPAANRLFWFATAELISEVVMPKDAMRSGLSQIRMA